MKQRKYKIFFSSLPASITNQQFTQKINRIFNPARIQFMKNKKKQSNRYGYIEFKSKEQMKYALDYELKFMGRRVLFQEYLSGKALLKKQKKVDECRVFVKQIPREVNDDDLFETFKHYGELESAFKVYTEGEPSSFGFVTFRNEINAKKCIKTKSVKVGPYNLLCFPFLKESHKKPLNFSEKKETVEGGSNNSPEAGLKQLRKRAYWKKFAYLRPSCSRFYKYDRGMEHNDSNLMFKPVSKKISVIINKDSRSYFKGTNVHVRNGVCFLADHKKGNFDITNY